MEIIFELLWSVIGEVLFQLLAEIFIETGWRSTGHPFRQRSQAHPVIAAIGLLLLGAIGGFVFWLAVPDRLFTGTVPLPGASLVLSPLATGTVMEAYGRWRRKRGAQTSFAATFLGGALFSLAMTATRFVLIRSWA